jgi:hypothetical protein
MHNSTISIGKCVFYAKVNIALPYLSGAFPRSRYSLFHVSGGGKAAAGNMKRAQTCRSIGARVAVFFQMKISEMK